MCGARPTALFAGFCLHVFTGCPSTLHTRHGLPAGSRLPPSHPKPHQGAAAPYGLLSGASGNSAGGVSGTWGSLVP